MVKGEKKLNVHEQLRLWMFINSKNIVMISRSTILIFHLQLYLGFLSVGKKILSKAKRILTTLFQVSSQFAQP
jgi:hypothetical protein